MRYRGFCLLFACLLLACEKQSSSGNPGSETHWLSACDTSSDCTAGSCQCGVCTIACAETSECDALDPARDVRCVEAAFVGACDQTAFAGKACFPESALQVPASAGGTDGGSAGLGSGGSTGGAGPEPPPGDAGRGGEAQAPDAGGSGGTATVGTAGLACGRSRCAASETCCEPVCGYCEPDVSMCEPVAPCSPVCTAMDATGVGVGGPLLGYAWDATACTPIRGDECEGVDCGALFESLAACDSYHQECPAPMSTACPAGPPSGACSVEGQVCEYAGSPSPVVATCTGGTWINEAGEVAPGYACPEARPVDGSECPAPPTPAHSPLVCLYDCDDRLCAGQPDCGGAQVNCAELDSVFLWTLQRDDCDPG